MIPLKNKNTLDLQAQNIQGLQVLNIQDHLVLNTQGPQVQREIFSMMLLLKKIRVLILNLILNHKVKKLSGRFKNLQINKVFLVKTL